MDVTALVSVRIYSVCLSLLRVLISHGMLQSGLVLEIVTQCNVISPTDLVTHI